MFNFVTNLYDKENKKFNINLEDEIVENFNKVIMEIDPFIFRFSIFILSIFVGYYVVWVLLPHYTSSHVGNKCHIFCNNCWSNNSSFSKHRDNVFSFSSTFGYLAILLAAINILEAFSYSKNVSNVQKKKKDK